MTLHFYIRFHTNPGESLSISGNTFPLGNSLPAAATPLQYLDNNTWQGSFEINPGETPLLYYRYILHVPGKEPIIEGGNDRTIDLSKKGIEQIRINDVWNNPAEYENVFYTAPFKDVLLKGHNHGKPGRIKEFTHIFKVKAPLVNKHVVVCLAGSGTALGNWNTTDPVLLHKEGNWWGLKIDLSLESFPLQYKYGIYDTKQNRFVCFENGENRILNGDFSSSDQLTILHDGFIYLPNNTWHAAGVCIPVFSLRSKNSFGVGEFSDLKLLADWASETGLKVIQILPVNDTTATYTWQDSYPYSAVSAFALHPIYINLEKVAGKKDEDILKPLKKKQKELNDLASLDYEEVYKSKMAVLKVLFAAQKEDFLKDPDFLEFFKCNRHWLIPYAAFCYLRDKNGTPDYSKWKIYKDYDKEAIEKYVSPKAKHYNEIATQYFIQYHLHLQLKNAAEHAHKKGVVLKGDIPIGIYRYSCDAWVNPDLYNMNMQAGAPPDDFAVKGQNWGFPTYNWKKMEEDGFLWWRQRFEQMKDYFDAFRIDHILGFFRIWSIPMDAVEGIMGHFEPAIPVHINEFAERNIRFDHDRYTKPYITGPVLKEIFGEDAAIVQENYLTNTGNDNFELKEAFNTQRKVEAHFAGEGQDERNLKLKTGLYDLISNILLIGVEGSEGSQFHFRISMQHSSSYNNLDWDLRQQLNALYINYFYERQNSFWEREAMRKLPALKDATDMLVCGEDLGMVPDCVPDVMRGLSIQSLEVQRMPKNPRLEFFNPHNAPYLSVVTPSTHDMSTIRGWWEEDSYRTQHFYNLELGGQGKAPDHCEPWINRSVLLQHLYSPALLSIFLWQDIMGMSAGLRYPDPAAERINVPADPHHYWKYRMHLPLETLLKEKEFNQELKDCIKASGRG